MTLRRNPDNSLTICKKIAFLGLAFSLLLLRVYPVHAVSKTANITVTATLVPTCIAGTLVGGVTSFGNLNFGSASVLNLPISVTGQTNNGTISVQCSNKTSFSVLLNGGQSSNVSSRYLMGGPSNQHVNYNLYTDAAHSQVWNNTVGVAQIATGLPISLIVYGLIPAQSTPAAGVYTDTIQVTINW